MHNNTEETEEAKGPQPPISAQEVAIEEVDDAVKRIRIRPVSGCTPYAYR